VKDAMRQNGDQDILDKVERQAHTFIDVLGMWSEFYADERELYSFISDDGSVELITYKEMELKAKAIAVSLLERGLQPGQRAILMYAPGLEFLLGFFSCIYAGIIAIPIFPPNPKKSLTVFENIIRNSGSRAILTVSEFVSMTKIMMESATIINPVSVLSTNAIDPNLARNWIHPKTDGKDIAFIQYTSGTTGDPKGVIVNHDRLMHNEAVIKNKFSHPPGIKGVGWLPFYHDMGLIGNILQSLYSGGSCALLSPISFIQKPFRWLEAISRHRAHTSGGPNFSYELCVNRITDVQIETLDLSSWKVAFTGAEPVDVKTMKRFYEKFSPCGFQYSSFYPCYGLAEATLIVSGGRASDEPIYKNCDAESLANGSVCFVDETTPLNGVRQIVSCGTAGDDLDILIVDVETNTPCNEDQIGEVWVSGDSVSSGYWENMEKTRETFQATLKGQSKHYMRTGDLGFRDKEEQLFIVGRLKDLIILRGKNYYATDLEQPIRLAHRLIRQGGVAVFPTVVHTDQSSKEHFVVAVEVSAKHSGDELPAVTQSIRDTLYENENLSPLEVVLLAPGGISKTSSGKIQRRRMRELWEKNDLTALYRDSEKPPSKISTAPLKQQKMSLDEMKPRLTNDFSNYSAHSVILSNSI
jgi:acyl-CoA synthetase (AMP-forming)/AMP-acid ligase II